MKMPFTSNHIKNTVRLAQVSVSLFAKGIFGREETFVHTDLRTKLNEI